MADFNKRNYKEYFHYDKYKNLSPAEREQLIRTAVDDIARRKGIKEVELSFVENTKNDPDFEKWRGSCSTKLEGNEVKKHVIRLNADVLERDDAVAPYSVYKTVHHETEHAVQTEKNVNLKIKNKDPERLESRLNDRHYYQSDGDRVRTVNGSKTRFGENIDYQLYRGQSQEADARKAGLKGIEELRDRRIEDKHLDRYLQDEKNREIMSNQKMLKNLGMHTRESLAREEINMMYKGLISEKEEERVLSYAREKDFETAKEVLSNDSEGRYSENDMKRIFENDEVYPDFFKTDAYENNKVTAAEHKDYVIRGYDWASVKVRRSSEENAEEFAGQGEENMDNDNGYKLPEPEEENIDNDNAYKLPELEEENIDNDNAYKLPEQEKERTDGENAGLLPESCSEDREIERDVRRSEGGSEYKLPDPLEEDKEISKETEQRENAENTRNLPDPESEEDNSAEESPSLPDEEESEDSQQKAAFSEGYDKNVYNGTEENGMNNEYGQNR